MTEIALLNCAILTSYGTFNMTPITIEDAKELIRDNGGLFKSYIAYESMTQILSLLLDQPVVINREEFKHKTGQLAIVFSLNIRGLEGKSIYSRRN